MEKQSKLTIVIIAVLLAVICGLVGYIVGAKLSGTKTNDTEVTEKTKEETVNISGVYKYTDEETHKTYYELKIVNNDEVYFNTTFALTMEYKGKLEVKDNKAIFTVTHVKESDEFVVDKDVMAINEKDDNDVSNDYTLVFDIIDSNTLKTEDLSLSDEQTSIILKK